MTSEKQQLENVYQEICKLAELTKDNVVEYQLYIARKALHIAIGSLL